MSKKAFILSLALVMVIGASIAYVLMQKSEQLPANKDSSSNVIPEPSDKKDEVPTETNGTYVEYSDELLASTKGTKLLFFHAPWCPQCRALDESIRSSALPNDVTIFKVDYDSHQALRAKYGVTIQTTVVKVDDTGEKLASYVAYDEPTFSRLKQALLP